jgi:hypothetical protein
MPGWLLLEVVQLVPDFIVANDVDVKSVTKIPKLEVRIQEFECRTHGSHSPAGTEAGAHDFVVNRGSQSLLYD